MCNKIYQNFCARFAHDEQSDASSHNDADGSDGDDDRHPSFESPSQVQQRRWKGRHVFADTVFTFFANVTFKGHFGWLNVRTVEFKSVLGSVLS